MKKIIILLGVIFSFIIVFHILPVDVTLSKVKEGDIVGVWVLTESSARIFEEHKKIKAEEVYLNIYKDGSYLLNFDYGNSKYSRFKKGKWEYKSKQMMGIKRNWLKLDVPPYSEENILWSRPDFFFKNSDSGIRMYYLYLSKDINEYVFSKK